MTSNTTRIASGSSSERDGPECLLRHANEVRRHANLDTLDAYLSQSGYSWIEMMMSHAKDSIENYQQRSPQKSNSATERQAFEHQMAADLLKTPSPKKKRAAALRHKLPSARPQMHTSQSNDPFSDDANKENQTTLPSSTLKNNVKEKNIKDVSDAKDEVKEPQRNTRARGDKSQLVQLPNPFLPRSSAETNVEQSSKPAEEESVAKKAKEPKKQAVKAKTKTKAKPVTENATEAKSKDNKQEILREKEVKADEKAMPAPTAAAVQKEAQATEFVDDSQEVEYSLQVASHEDLAASRNGSHSQRIQPSQSIQKLAEIPEPIIEKETPPPIEDEERSDDEYEIKRPTREKSESPSPRESTPPPLSPTKAQRAAQTVMAREKLEESLLKLASDDEDSEDEVSMSEVLMKGTSGAPKAAKPLNSQAARKELQQPTKAAEDDDAGDESTVEEEAILEQTKVQNAAAPKRTLSSIAHAKKSIAGSSSGVRQQGRSSSMAPSAFTGGAKTSFLSKSIMKVEQDQKSLDDSLELIASSSSSPRSSELKKLDDKKRKSEEAELETVEDAPVSKTAKRNADEEEAELKTTSKSKQTESKPTQEEKQKSTTGSQAQSFRQKIESFSTNKTSNLTTNASSSQTKSSRNFSSMSTHSVGLGATKISSPIFSRSNSQNTIAPEPQSPSHDVAKVKDSVQRSPKAAKSDAKKDQAVPEKVKEPVSTTPLNSPGPSALSLYPKLSELQKKQRQATKSTSPVKAVKQAAAKEKQVEDDLSDSDLGAYDTSTDGDLSLVDLVDNNATMKASATAPRPPGTSLRPMSALPKTTGTAPPSAQKASAFMPSSTANAKTSRPVSRLGKPIEDQSVSSAVSTASSNTAASTATTSSLNNSIHASWGGSISSKLKGILGFSSTSPGKNTTATPHMSASTSTKPSSIKSKQGSGPISIPARKESFISSSQGNTGSRIGTTAQTSTATEKKPASVVRADLAKKKEAEQAEKRVKEKEERAKAAAAVAAAAESAKKRVRDEQAQQAAKNKPASVGPAAGKAISSQSAQRPVDVANQPDAKKRKSNDGVAVPTKMPTITKQASSQALKTKASATSVASSQINKTASMKVAQANPTPNVFSNHNSFQSAQSSQQQQALAAVSQQMQIHKAKNVVQATSQNIQMLSPNSKMKVAATGHIELEEPDSAYSDSEDEETIRKRLQHKPWETREGLASALEAQADIDADLIFGIPQGAVPLDDILPAQSEHARVRRMRPRSSSATWSRDGLKQFEIDRYNERMGIKGPGATLNGNTVGSGISKDDGSGTPNRAGRMSALAQSAIAQGQMSSKKQRHQ
ncbi:uncharacterized protein FA14DRAFT_161787 [Meira miltonrushii]|uniref:Uncharacterized protein n=1 Tax=Meira miltonrushii TaxID=1280837 RepID=A0A316VAU0_9BASI|nr:uncharacterized protein FA14DRAFT_161787 [Meira miltonrushii]PWN34374.1 hypothetical protein FA14DRAFT_161787 [Meira miltonrushii]